MRGMMEWRAGAVEEEDVAPKTVVASWGVVGLEGCGLGKRCL